MTEEVKPKRLDGNIKPSVLWYRKDDDKVRDKETGGIANVLQYIAFPAAMEENHSSSATVSKYPVQRGFEISNHLIRHNRVINIRAFIPETTLGGIDADGAESAAMLAATASSLIPGLPSEIGTFAPIAGGILADPLGTVGNYLHGAESSVSTSVAGITGLVDALPDFVGDSFIGDAVDTVNEWLPSSSRRIHAFKEFKFIQENGILCKLSTVLEEYVNLVLVDISIPTNADTYTTMFVDLTFEEVRIVDAEGKLVTTLGGKEVTEEEEEAAMKQADKLHDSTLMSTVEGFSMGVADSVGLGGMFA